MIYGIPECSKGMSRYNRSAQDLQNVTSVISKIDSNMNEFSVRDCYRLGKYKQDAPHSRPILAVFTRAADVVSILSNRSKLTQSIVIKPDMSPAERADQATLLKERWHLIQSGTEKSSIKIRNNVLYVNKRAHGQAINSEYQKYPLMSHLSPVLNNFNDDDLTPEGANAPSPLPNSTPPSDPISSTSNTSSPSS